MTATTGPRRAAAVADAPVPARRGAPGIVSAHLALHALVFLVAACAVGLTLALLLLVPDAGRMLGPITYGRLAPVHLDVALYGWCGLPLAGLLLAWYRGRDDASRAARVATEAWAGALWAGAFCWLAGQTTGKVFLDWAGVARGLFIAALCVLALVLGDGLRRGPRAPRGAFRAKAILLAALCTVPVALVVATSRASYPPVNPRSGGPTGADLLGSTLIVVWVFLFAPSLLGVTHPRGDGPRRTLAWICAAQTVLFFVVRARGATTEADPVQYLSLATLVLWAWALPRFLLAHPWPAAARRWVLAFLWWALALLVTGVGAFLPGVLPLVKFTNALVGHAHIAMAGMATAFGALVLVVLTRPGPVEDALAGDGPFWTWHGGAVLHVVALIAAGALEVKDPGVLFRPDATITTLYALRALAGAAMLGAAIAFLRGGVAQIAAAEAAGRRTREETA